VEENKLTDDGSRHPKKGREKSGPGVMSKKTLIIAGIVIVLFLIAVIAVAVIIQRTSEQGTGQSNVIKNFTQPETGFPATRTTIIPNTIPPTAIMTISVTSVVKPKATEPVDFTIQTGEPANCGLTCRQMDAMLTNSGDSTAHNVCITVSLHNSRNEIINLNGESSLNRCVGDVAGGQTITEPITINADCGPFATLCIGETLTLQTQIVSDEKTVRFPNQVISV
jgi:flagellar basal body-associated protein FliL